MSTSIDMNNRTAGSHLRQIKESRNGGDVIIVSDHDQDDGLIEADDNYEEYFFRDQGEDE